jgi:two-component system invasion response regulator UvrY
VTRILLVDDNEAFRRSARAALAQVLGAVTVGEADTAAAALDRIGGEPWDVVLLDLSLPDRRGFDTLRDIRRLSPTLPVIVMSFHPEAEYAGAARAAGAAGYIAKGSSAEIMAAAVTAALATPPDDAPERDRRRPQR